MIYSKELSDGRECGSVAQAVRIAPQSGWIDPHRRPLGRLKPALSQLTPNRSSL